MGRLGRNGRVEVLDASEEARADALAESIRPFTPDAPPVLERFVEDFRKLLGAQVGVAMGTGAAGDGFAMTFAFASGAGEDLLPEVDAWMHRSPTRWALYDPTEPEPRQRNAVINVGRYLDLVEKEAEGEQLRGFGVDRAAVELARERLARAERLPAVAWLVRQHQLRALICDGPRLLAWVGVVDSGALGPREEALFARVVPGLQRRLSLERRLESAAVKESGFEAALDALPAAAFLVDSHGAIRHANGHGQTWWERDRRGLAELLQRAARGERTGFRTTPLHAPGQPPHLLAIWERASEDHSRRLEEFSLRHRLSRREHEVLSLITRGEPNKRIASALGCSEKTVELHITHVLRKTGTRTRTELTALFWAR